MNTPSKKTLAKFEILEHLFNASLVYSRWSIENWGEEIFSESYLNDHSIELNQVIREFYYNILNDLDISLESWINALNESTSHIYCIREYSGIGKVIAREFKGHFYSMVDTDMMKALKEVFTP